MLIFATGNNRKITEATKILNEYGISFSSQKVSIDEIQHSDPAEITKAKAIAAYKAIAKPVVVSDTSWSIPALGGFPGGYMKDIAAYWQTEDWLAVIKRHRDKRIICHEHIAYYDGSEVVHFVSDYEGKFVDTPRGLVNDDESFESVVVLYGDRTMAEQLEAGEVASAGEDLHHWKQFARWYNKNKVA